MKTKGLITGTYDILCVDNTVFARLAVTILHFQKLKVLLSEDFKILKT